MKKRVFRMLGVLLVAASLMIITRQLIHVQAGPSCGPDTTTSTTTSTVPCPSTTTSTSSAPAAPAAPAVTGCDFGIPTQTVVGAITVPSTLTFYAPNNDAIISGVTLTQGSKWLVIGLNSTKEFYKIKIGCALAWIPVGAIGPSPDGPLAGAPLPTLIVSDSLSTPN